jgi:ketosteroid isomerase-like protein
MEYNIGGNTTPPSAGYSEGGNFMKFSKFTKLTSFFILGAVAAKSLLSGKKAGSGKIDAARCAVEAANSKFREAVRLGKAGDIAALYTEDASVLPPNQGIVRGRESIEAFWRAVLDTGVKDAVLTTAEVGVSGRWIREIGTFTIKIWPEGKAAWEDKGKYLVIWKKEDDGSVKVESDIWNSSLPPGK